MSMSRGLRKSTALKPAKPVSCVFVMSSLKGCVIPVCKHAAGISFRFGPRRTMLWLQTIEGPWRLNRLQKAQVCPRHASRGNTLMLVVLHNTLQSTAHQYFLVSLSCAAAFSAISLLKPYSVPYSTATGLLSSSGLSSAALRPSTAALPVTPSLPTASAFWGTLRQTRKWCTTDTQTSLWLQDAMLLRSSKEGALMLIATGQRRGWRPLAA